MRTIRTIVGKMKTMQRSVQSCRKLAFFFRSAEFPALPAAHSQHLPWPDVDMAGFYKARLRGSKLFTMTALRFQSTHEKV